jgi:hydrocephalus-inducing protein
MAPKFQFVPNSLDFGRSSYSFAKPKTIKLENRSNVPFKFSLRIPGDGKLSKKEFEIKPSQDIIQAKQSMNIEVIFIPQVPKIYDMVMVIDLDGIGQDMFSLPIKGVCEVPNVRIEPSYELTFG